MTRLLILQHVSPLSLVDELRADPLFSHIDYVPHHPFGARPDDVFPSDDQLEKAEVIFSFVAPKGVDSVEKTPNLKLFQASRSAEAANKCTLYRYVIYRDFQPATLMLRTRRTSSLSQRKATSHSPTLVVFTCRWPARAYVCLVSNPADPPRFDVPQIHNRRACHLHHPNASAPPAHHHVQAACRQGLVPS